MASLEPDGDNSGIDFARLLRLVWQGRGTVVIMTVISALLTILYLHTLTYSYSATMVLVPTQSQAPSAASSQLGGLASLAGINLPGTQSTSPFTVYADTLQTRDVADEVIRHDPSILRRLFGYEWNDQTGRYEEQSSLRHTLSGIIKPVLGIPVTSWSAPSGADLQVYIANAVKPAIDPKRPVVTLSFLDPDPVFASYFLRLVHRATDDVLRRMTLDRSSKYAKYLEDKLQGTQTSDMRQVLVQSLSQQETLVMMGSSSTYFAAQPLGAPVVSLYPVQPRGSLILIAGIVVGFVLGGLMAANGISLVGLWRTAGGLARNFRR